MVLLLGVYTGRWEWARMKARLQNCSSEGYAWGCNKSLIMTFGMGMRAETHGGCPTMNAGTRQILEVAEQAKKKINSNGGRRTNIAVGESAMRVNGGAGVGRKPRGFVAAENRLLPEALSRMLAKNEEIEGVGVGLPETFPPQDLLQEKTEL